MLMSLISSCGGSSDKKTKTKQKSQSFAVRECQVQQQQIQAILTDSNHMPYTIPVMGKIKSVVHIYLVKTLFFFPGGTKKTVVAKVPKPPFTKN